MYSDAVSKIIESNGNGFHQQVEVFEKWKDWHPSQISHHGGMCCEIAREWIAASDYSALGGDSVYTGPRWLRQKFNWGASSFPIYWCEVVRKKTLDCGALAALSHEIFTLRGVKSFRAQMVQKFSEVATSQWSCSWSDTDSAALLNWINNDLIYHEGCVIVMENREIKVWDSSAGWWIDPKPTGDGYGALLAIRVQSNDVSKTFNWGNHCIIANRWQKVY